MAIDEPAWAIKVEDTIPGPREKEPPEEEEERNLPGEPVPVPPETPRPQLDPAVIEWVVKWGMEAAAAADQDEFYRATPEELADVIPSLTERLNATLPTEWLAQLQTLEDLIAWWPTLKFFWRRALHAYRVHVAGTETRISKGGTEKYDSARQRDPESEDSGAGLDR